MSSILRPLAASASRASKQLAAARAFHTPFAVLNQAPVATPSSSTSHTSNAFAKYYEKESDYAHEPYQSIAGQRTYVVSEPDASFRHYEVPAGAYPISSPYSSYSAATEASVDVSATAADILAQPLASRTASVAPGAMGRRGGSYGGAAKSGVQNTGKMRV